LIPNAKDAEFKALLNEIRPKVAAHLQEAKDIQQALTSPEPAGTDEGTSHGSGSMPHP
jgi:hypothetical protein